MPRLIRTEAYTDEYFLREQHGKGQGDTKATLRFREGFLGKEILKADVQ